MNVPSLRFVDPPEFTDENIAQILEFLYELASALESHYAGQLRRYYQPFEPPEPEPDLFDDFGDDLPSF